jgi:hypothetical protein
MVSYRSVSPVDPSGCVTGLTLVITGPPPRELPCDHDNGPGAPWSPPWLAFPQVRGRDPARQASAFPGGLHLVETSTNLADSLLQRDGGAEAAWCVSEGVQSHA